MSDVVLLVLLSTEHQGMFRYLLCACKVCWNAAVYSLSDRADMAFPINPPSRNLHAFKAQQILTVNFCRQFEGLLLM